MSKIKFRGRTIEILPVLNLEVDPSFQRPICQSHVIRIVKEFDERAVKPFHISRRSNGKLIILDGQQEWDALKRIGWTETVCVVYDGLTRAQEAKLFYLLNQAKPVTVKCKFRALVKAKDREALEIYNLIRENGFQVCLTSGRPQAGAQVIQAVGALWNIYRWGTASVLETTLATIKGAFGIRNSFLVDEWAIKDQFILGVAKFVADNDLDADQAIEMLSGVRAEDIYRKAIDEAGQCRRGLDKAIAKLLNLRVKPRRRAA